jgi:hypothetical protein
MTDTKIKKEHKKSFVLYEKSVTCPKIIYTYIDSPESVQKLNEVYDMIFDQVLKSESWKKYKSEHHN